MSGNDASTMQQELCNTQETMLGVSWTFTIAWVIMFIVWCIIIFATCRRPVAGRRASGPCPKCHPMQWLMLIVPFFHLGEAIWQVWTYTHCTCMVCQLASWSDMMVWKVSEYIFALGRLSALLLCLYCISTGAGTIRPYLTIKNVVLLVTLFGGFITAMALGLPLTVVSLGIDSTAAFAWSLIMYAGILIVILSDAYSNSKVSLLRPWPLRCLGSLSGDGTRIRDFPRSTRGADGPLLRMHISFAARPLTPCRPYIRALACRRSSRRSS